MKVSAETTLDAPVEVPPQRLSLPQGLVGFPKHTSFELFYNSEQLPFRWLNMHGPTPLQFVVIEPGGVVPDYEAELFDEDAEFLDIRDAADAIVLNIVTVSRTEPVTATANLAAPIVINRRTGLSKQVVLANYARYSVRYPLVTAN